MKLNLLFFGSLTDVTGTARLEFTEDISNVEALNKQMHSSFPGMDRYKYKIAVNQEIVTDEKKLNDGDEVAFLPPFAGG